MWWEKYKFRRIDDSRFVVVNGVIYDFYIKITPLRNSLREYYYYDNDSGIIRIYLTTMHSKGISIIGRTEAKEKFPEHFF